MGYIGGMPTSYEIGPFRLDTGAEILYRGTEPVAVGQRAVALLGVLVARAPGRRSPRRR
jgi:DNA-binding winged helix-turn-helix (wHTH) protein